ncbi:hypothetical protein E2C01_028297 [Portunus trituberculatus]|uniref:Uncharacterized protein n=1 Tax=Portunus trituberculatus TaxID=210409 RepID=A0A5B7EN96_PORTR|nr:hypothetical protein [Portunus trituberculatus]
MRLQILVRLNLRQFPAGSPAAAGAAGVTDCGSVKYKTRTEGGNPPASSPHANTVGRVGRSEAKLVPLGECKRQDPRPLHAGLTHGEGGGEDVGVWGVGCLDAARRCWANRLIT